MADKESVDKKAEIKVRYLKEFIFVESDEYDELGFWGPVIDIDGNKIKTWNGFDFLPDRSLHYFSHTESEKEYNIYGSGGPWITRTYSSNGKIKKEEYFLDVYEMEDMLEHKNLIRRKLKSVIECNNAKNYAGALKLLKEVADVYTSKGRVVPDNIRGPISYLEDMIKDKNLS